jgi:hypothetical protein
MDEMEGGLFMSGEIRLKNVFFNSRIRRRLFQRASPWSGHLVWGRWVRAQGSVQDGTLRWSCHSGKIYLSNIIILYKYWKSRTNNSPK